MPKELQTRSSRQRPVSCHFCRSRKLRCNREAPCSNCTSRGISCELETLSRPPDTDGPSKTQLLDRIRKLEELVDKVNKDSRQSTTGQQSSESAGHCTQPTPESDLSPHVQHLEKDVAYLESVYDAGGSQRSHDELLHSKFRFRICPVQDMREMQQPQNSYSFSTAGAGLVKHVWLPQYSEAKVLFEKYLRYIAHFHHVYHLPSLPDVLERVYSCLNSQAHVKLGDVILLLSIFGSSSHSWSVDDCRDCHLFPSIMEAHSQSEVWVAAAEDLIKLANKSIPASIEAIQGIITIMFVAKATDGFSRRCRSFTYVALSLARELGLHYIDHPSKAHLANTVQAEVGRRVWWWLVSCDWAMAARFNDVRMGVYQCHLRHMMTNKPLNLDDEYLVDGMSRAGMPISQPTVLSYTLQRIRMAEISRNMADRTSPLTTHGSAQSYHVIMDTDYELQILLNETPPFFSMSVKDMCRIYLIDEHKAKCIIQQGHKFFSLLYALRCKLHLPYLSRAFTDPEYASSRDICIQSARLILQTEADLEAADLCPATRYKPLGLIMSVFMACIVLIMDLCHSKDSQHRERQRSEIARALRMLEEARHESQLVAKFLDSMMQILHKHKIIPPKLAGQPTQMPGLQEKDSAAMSTQDDHLYGFLSMSTPTSISLPPSKSQMNNGSSCVGVNGDGFATEEDIPYLCELTHSLNEGIDVGDFNWDDIFLDLDASFL